MYLAVDVGGTKTLLASFEESGGTPVKEVRFPTPEKYEDFLKDLAKHLTELDVEHFSAAGVGMPGRLDRENGICISYGNLGWKNTPVKADLEKVLNCPVFVENDAKVGGLSEAKLIGNGYNSVLYIPFGTGIGVAYIKNGVIDTTYGDRGGRAVLVNFEGRSDVIWEDIASGRAIKKRFGKIATDITDEESWKFIAHLWALGLKKLIDEREPEAVVIGGGAGKQFDRYGEYLKDELQVILDPTPFPAIVPAKHPEEAVLYGCIDLIKQNHG